MKLGDIYKHKKEKKIIQIESFATHLAEGKNMVIIYGNIEDHKNGEIGICPSFNGYGTQDEIEEKYKLLVPQDKLSEYKTWEEVFELLNNK